ncbi:MAG: MFS transporter [Bacteroidales bacterium]|nr:MFS transporter [Bacteroidales bacterium]
MYSQEKYSKRAVGAIKLLYLFLYIGMASWSTQFYAFLERDRALTGFQIGMIAAVQQINNMLILPFWGMVSDRYGRRKIFLILLACAALCIEGFLANGNFIFYLGFIILFTAINNPLAALADSFALEKASLSVVNSGYGNMRLWASLGWALSSFATGYLIKDLGLSFGIIFPITTVSYLVTWIVAFFSLNQKHESKTKKSPSIKTLKELLLTNRKLLYFFLFCMVYYMFNAPIQNMISIYYTELCAAYYEGFSLADLNAKIGLIVGIAFGIQSMFELPFMFYADKILKRFGTKQVIFFTMFVAVVRMVLYGFSSNPWFSVVVGCLHGITLGLFWCAAIGYVHSLVPIEQNSTGQMLFNTFLAIGTCIGNLLTGFMKDYITLSLGMRINAVLILLLLLACFILLKFRNRFRF